MQKKELIEKLNDLATFFSLAASDASKRRKGSATILSVDGVAFWEGREDAFKTAFEKVDKIIKEAKR